jgi:hypothetical protein
VASRVKKGRYGMTVPRVDNVLGTVVVCNRTFNNIKGEIISVRDNYLKYFTVQVPSEYQGRVYVLNLLSSQCKNIQWRS